MDNVVCCGDNGFFYKVNDAGYDSNTCVVCTPIKNASGLTVMHFSGHGSTFVYSVLHKMHIAPFVTRSSFLIVSGASSDTCWSSSHYGSLVQLVQKQKVDEST